MRSMWGTLRVICWWVTTETPQTRTNKNPGAKQKCKPNTFHMAHCRICPRLRDCVRSLDKQTDTIKEESRRFCDTFKTTRVLTHAHTNARIRHLWQVHLSGLYVRVRPHCWLKHRGQIDGTSCFLGRDCLTSLIKRSYIGKNANFRPGNFMTLFYYLVKVDHRFRMDADELQAGPVALKELCKQPEKDGPHLLVLEHTHKHYSSNSYSTNAVW